jgi:hypothetical protein
MSEREQGTNVVELLLREPEIVAWLEPGPADEPDDETGVGSTEPARSGGPGFAGPGADWEPPRAA